MADILLDSKEETDIAVRYGGDEYVILSAHLSEDECAEKFNKIKSCIVEPISASAGFSFRKIPDMSQIKDLIEDADKKMYEDKKRRKQERK